MNGLLLFGISLAVGAGTWAAGLYSASRVLAALIPLLLAANAFALLLSVVLFARGRRADDGAPAGPWRHLLMGTERDPEWLGVDLKLFSYRPSMIGLALVNLFLAEAQYETYGRIFPRMAIYQIFYFLYVANYFAFERGMLYTWDVMAERFGGMLIWGDYVLVPFFYSLPGWFLLDRTDPIPPLSLAALAALYGAGFWLFRGANGQKHRFKVDPSARIWGRPAESVGGRLLVSGFWGWGRKLNYTGELCMYWAWTLPCGFQSFVPYLLPLWLTFFFPHRAWRDDRRCREKYGALWTEYCRRVRFRMLPFLY